MPRLLSVLVLACCLAACAIAFGQGAPYEVVEPLPEPYYPFLEGETQGSVSLGDVTSGTLVRGRRVPLPGRGHTLLPRHGRRGLIYGTDELVDMLEFVGYRLRRRRGHLLRIGNLARAGGGDISYSVSHNSGRDVDLAFCYQNEKGKRVRASDFIALDADGKSRKHRGKYRFDAKCTWSIVAAVLRHPGTQVQYIFISNPLKKMLLDYARSAGQSPRLVTRAGAVLFQPGRRTHDDHLHIRVYCSREDIGMGCVNNGVEHPWVDMYPGAREEAVTRLVAHLGHTDPEQRARAVERLVLVHAKEALADVRGLLKDASPRVRAASATAISALGTEADTDALAAAFAVEKDPRVQSALFDGAMDLGGPGAKKLLNEALGRGSGVPESVLAEAFARAGLSEDTAFVEPLLAWIGEDAGRWRDAAQNALCLLTNHAFGTGPEWRAWWGKSKGKERDQLLVDGFVAAGIEVSALERKQVWRLVPALLGEPHTAHNAREVLSRLTGHTPRARPPEDACRHWADWLSRKRRALRLPRPPRGLSRACRR